MNHLNSRVLNFKQGCELLGFSASYVYKLTSSRILPFSKPNGKSIFFDKEKLEEWMLSNASESSKNVQIAAATYIKTKGGIK